MSNKVSKFEIFDWSILNELGPKEDGSFKLL